MPRGGILVYKLGISLQRVSHIEQSETLEYAKLEDVAKVSHVFPGVCSGSVLCVGTACSPL